MLFGVTDGYQDFVKARQASNNYIRKGGKPNGIGVQVLRTDKLGNLLYGNRKIESYDPVTGILIYANKNNNNNKKVN